MKELLRTNDLVELSWAQAMLQDAGIEHHVFDTHISAVEGWIQAFQRRLMVPDEDFDRARRLLREAGDELGTSGPFG